MRPDTKASIMAVDDQPANLRLLQQMLGQQGYQVRLFPGGLAALVSAERYPPDLVLLDINMPGMNGFEVCAQLKALPALASIPVIFLSALSEADDKVRAFQAGGVDYVTKPFQLEEVQSRVETQLRLHRLQQQLRADAQHLEELVQSRTHQLAEAHARLRLLDGAKSEFLKLISHELRTPLNGLLGIGDLLLQEAGEADDVTELRTLFEQSSRRLLSMTEHALLLTQIEVEGETFRRDLVPLRSLVAEALNAAAALAAARNVSFDSDPLAEHQVLGDSSLLVKALCALLETAVRFSRAGTVVRISMGGGASDTILRIRSCGANVPQTCLPRFFDPFSLSEASTAAGDLGLGPAVAYRILVLFGHAATIDNTAPDATEIAVRFVR
jgi:two-component system, sensor histidine kinase and response regulator